jgi:hypothetical protein
MQHDYSIATVALSTTRGLCNTHRVAKAITVYIDTHYSTLYMLIQLCAHLSVGAHVLDVAQQRNDIEGNSIASQQWQ